MNLEKGKFKIYQELCRQTGGQCFKFASMKGNYATAPSLTSDIWNLSFSVGAPLHEIQITLTFCEDWVDVLAFPHPRVIKEKYVLEMVRFVNSLNGYVKLQNTNGRFYVDEDYLDVVYSARLSYRYLDVMPQAAVCHGILGFLGFVMDMALPLYQIGQGIMTAKEGCQYMMELWES